ncbi:transposase [Nonomuraea antimicrobica]|uniref:transposase n=1 Tax=Nonomuraea antimicrobica TaxID=561173 RepID=UPI00360D7D35
MPWRYLPHGYPPWQTTYAYFAHWQKTASSTSSAACSAVPSAPVPRQNTATTALTCGLTGFVPAGKIASCACPPALADRAPGVRLADGAGPWSSVEGHGDHGVVSRSGSAAASGRMFPGPLCPFGALS